MKREKAQTLFEAGAVMACAVIPAPMKGAGYIMQIQRRDGHRPQRDQRDGGHQRQIQPAHGHGIDQTLVTRDTQRHEQSDDRESNEKRR